MTDSLIKTDGTSAGLSTGAAISDTDYLEIQQTTAAPASTVNQQFAAVKTWIKSWLNQPTRNPYVSGNWYLPDATQVLAPGSAIGATTIKAVPVLIRKATTITDLGCSVTTNNAGETIQMALYASDPVTGLPKGNVLSATPNVNAATAGRVSWALAAPQAVEPGLYWLAIQGSTGSVAVSTVSLSGPGLYATEIGNASLTALWPFSGTVLSGVSTMTGVTLFGTWPDLTSASFTGINGHWPFWNLFKQGLTWAYLNNPTDTNAPRRPMLELDSNGYPKSIVAGTPLTAKSSKAFGVATGSKLSVIALT